MKRLVIIFSALAGWLVAGQSCTKNDQATPGAAISFRRPANFPVAAYNFEENTLTKAGFELGHKLFYEDALSADNSVNCGTCHQPFAAFANLDHSVSHGINNCFGTRNAPPLFNLAWQKDFMWDGGVGHIELSPLNALTNPCEMGNTLDRITATLSQTAPYPELFREAFGSPVINSQRLFKALTQFMGMMVSASSKYDKVMRKENGASFSPDEQEGYRLFQQKCAVCHQEPLFTDGSFRSNGLDGYSKDPGRDTITATGADRGKFRVPSLRNIELTRPYMHDGRFLTLEAVLEHYHAGVKQSPALDPGLKKNPTPGIPLTPKEQSQIISFLKTLTDNEFIHDHRFAEL
ncbi:cytochrome-c peroxidase [Hufsiella ginkgonis]|uniref:C-type cytochrome n=1 Tax=Hufsiella ginkgonis TaxID=2695274 RepID=A0A7K1XWB0_9SPHI|nr:cytochrome c peroxidase [Hufsiella ginkgonis]MXV15284.1 c-type cytochrome [Hufsiella ginkgonis]